ncbi:MAG: LysR family transcriptional regulator [Micrococcales bacterium]|nr:MAG: LysR family transcriptional regulator [Micrococcales bacterium]PIE27740.1 MAG: LysR family transcriptional regulator [Micrococcales bacterium]
MPSMVHERIAAAGLSLPPVTAPLAAYVPALRTGHTIYVSGQLPFIDGQLTDHGKVGEHAGCVSPQRATELARYCALNALSALAGQADLETVRILKLTGFVSSDPGFTGQPAVIDGASEFLGEVLGEHGRHARSAVGVAVLPLDVPVELELIAAVL